MGFEVAKTWIEQKLAGMKIGVPNADASELTQGWSSSLEPDKLLGLDPGITEIEAANLAKQYVWWHLQSIRDMEQTQPDGVFRIMGGQLNSTDPAL